MPSYEPTPKRFSVLTVPSHASTSRRNSIDEPHLRPATDTSPKEAEERGRTSTRLQRSRRPDPIITTWGHDEPIRVPTARGRRDSSASTRDRIAEWEERSRSVSQSRRTARSKSRGVGAGSRVSVVPEVPEIAAAMARFAQEEEERKGAEGTAGDALRALEGEPRDEDAVERSEGIPDAVVEEREVVVEELMQDPWADGDISQSPRSDHDDTPMHTARMEIPTEREKVIEAEVRPQTPVRVSPQELPTPDATPQSVSKRTTGSPENAETGREHPATGAKTPTPPSTPTGYLGHQLTPMTTPETQKSTVQMTFGEELVKASPQPQSPIRQPSPPTEPTYRRITPTKAKEESDDEADPESRQAEATSKWPSPRTEHQLQPEPADDSRYHNVWRIQDYEPEFPLPAEPVLTLDADTRPDFNGNPLKSLPRSQLSAEAEPFQPAARVADPVEYAYKPKPRTGTGEFAVNIPPSPTTTYMPGDRPRLPPRPRSRSRGPREAARYTARTRAGKHEWDAPPVMERALHAASVSVIQGLTVPVELYRGLRDIYYPPPVRPDIVKAYPVRRKLPVRRIFFPSHHDLTSPLLLPTLFTIHGGGFTVGSPSDDDAWNRTFADTYSILVIALNYSKAPWAVFPAPLLDAEALYHAALNDESLPIDRMRTALCGFDAGGNLALGLAQLPSVKTGYDPSRHIGHATEYDTNPYPYAAPSRSSPPPAGVISVCGILDFGMSASRKARTRPYKRQLRGPRGWGPGLDWMARLLPSSAWSYIPYGHDIADPLLSPAYASRAELPPHVFVVAAELDCLAHESWRTACAWAGRAVPDVDVPVGRRGPSRWRGCLDDGGGEKAAKFAWGEQHTVMPGTKGFEGTTRWLLVPDVVHGFDSPGWRNKYLFGDEEARMDAEMKTIAYQRELAEWLWATVWR
ncbi:Arylacetamide deacetylase [Echria macrotheca]|uniref:Arylacetamide deacetylase n=1 Tax=Echria macrotheca TaxID=438768 RepID=A0AAJ0B0S8_9PEZI|nr:Arylacetamide deacetylase [Echria macrotheca]